MYLDGGFVEPIVWSEIFKLLNPIKVLGGGGVGNRKKFTVRKINLTMVVKGFYF